MKCHVVSCLVFLQNSSVCVCGIVCGYGVCVCVVYGVCVCVCVCVVYGCVCVCVHACVFAKSRG
jgi:hypothetical protein